MKLDWFSAASGAAVYAVGRWLLDAGGTWFKSHLEEKRTIRAEERERARKEHERKRGQAEHEVERIHEEERERAKKEDERRQLKAETLEQDNALLLALKAKVKGCHTWFEAVGYPGGLIQVGPIPAIHSYFQQRPQYLTISSNMDFLIKYPRGGPPDGFPDDGLDGLDDLKRDVDTLRVQ
jgi:hypothetical protein